ncbi:MAG TPA: hypothetical protein PLI34_02415, partial [Saprospiraceae bacterium]|nr:hypothetical protein [Saprospiraceae bacterium]
MFLEKSSFVRLFAARTGSENDMLTFLKNTRYEQLITKYPLPGVPFPDGGLPDSGHDIGAAKST